MGNITRGKLIFWKDRPTTGDDNGIIEVPHENLVHGDTYYYGIDAYDRYGNRSAMSEINSIVAGDVTAPGPVTATSSLGGYKSVEYYWTNPSDTDFDKIRIYNNVVLGTANLIDQIGGLKPSDNVSKTYMTVSDSETKTIYLTTLDRNNNENLSYVTISGVSEAAPGGGDADLEDGIAISIVDDTGYEWQGEAYLSAVALRNPYKVHIQTTTSVTAEHIYCFDSVGDTEFNTPTISLLTSAAGYRLYESNDITVDSTWAEGKGFLDIKVLDGGSSPLIDSMPIFVDRTVPNFVFTNSILIDKTASNTITNDRAVDVTMRIAPDASGVVGYVLSTSATITSTSWVGVSGDISGGSVIETSYTLPNVEKTYSLYGWLLDRAGNVSAAKQSAYTTTFKKLVDTPVGAIAFYTTGNVAIEPNVNGWFNQSVRVRYTSEVKQPGMTISSVFYRDNINGIGWGAWSTASAGTNPATLNVDYTSGEGIIAFEACARNSNGEMGGNASVTLRIDKTAPGMVAANFWNTTRSKSLDRRSVLYWDVGASGSDSGANPSGLNQTYIYRASSNSFAAAHTVEAVNIHKEWMIDDDDTLVTGHYYYYWGKYMDAAGNLSPASNSIYIQATYDFQHEYRNYVSNGSFERITGIQQTDSLGPYHRARDWEYGYNVAPTTENYAPVTTNSEKFGWYSCYMKTSNSTGGLRQQISIPSFSTTYSFSFYKNKLPGGTWNAVSYCLMSYHKPSGALCSPTGALLTISTPNGATWPRQSFTFGKGVAGMTYTIPSDCSSIKIKFLQEGTYNQDILIDGVQWEEGRTTTDYVDNQVINTQRINAGFIDANKVRARSLTADLIEAGTITANEIDAGTITANEIALSTITGDRISNTTITGGKIATDTITASNIAANAITTSELQANSVTAAKIGAGEVRATAIYAGAIDSTKISAQGLHVKSGGVSMITVGASSSPTTQDYHVLTQNDLYFHPRGYGADEHWHYVKHLETGVEEAGTYSFKRVFVAPSGDTFSPEVQVYPVQMLTSSPSLGAMCTYVGYSASYAGSNIWLGGGYIYNAPQVYTVLISGGGAISGSGGTRVLDLGRLLYTPYLGIHIVVPWVGPAGTEQSVRIKFDCSPDNITYYSLTEVRKVYFGGSGSVTYRQRLFVNSLSLCRYVRITYVSDRNGPATITSSNYEIDTKLNVGDASGTWVSGDINMKIAYIASDGFLQH